MTILQAVILGIVQGITEFLPISSSGHLVLVPFLFGWDFNSEEAFLFNVLVQVGTLVAVIIYFWRDLFGIGTSFLRGIFRRQPFAEPEARQGWYIILATIPASLTGLTFKDTIEVAFDSPVATALFLLGTAALLFIAERVKGRKNSMDRLSWVDALVIGCFQALALFPGVSRSGSTITGGMVRSLDRPSAARFSFLMMVPIMLAAGLLALIDLLSSPALGTFWLPLLVGFITAAATGYLAIHWLLRYLSRRPLTIFIIYCILLSLLILVLYTWKGAV